jgi:hypothetical protein
MSKKISICSIFGTTVAAVLSIGNATAATFSGYDINPNPPTTNPPFAGIPLNTANTPSSQAAFVDFSKKLNGATVTTESFETSATPVNTPIDGLSTSISGTTATFLYTKKSDNNTATTTGASTRVQTVDADGFTNSGTYPTQGVRGISINSANNFSISFSQKLAAFSYFGTDLGDNSNTLTMEFYNGTALILSNQIPFNSGSADSSEFFFGFIADNPTQEFNKVAFVSSISSNGDAIGIDQIKIATPAQIVPSPAVPEPATILGTLIFGGAAVARKRKQQLSKS